MDDEYLNQHQLAKRLGMTPSQLTQLRYRGEGPKFYKPSPRRVIYRWSDVEEWLTANQYTRTGEKVTA